ncbi:MAG: polysaccharide export protein [Bacteroidetes bacterium]|nr:MAG: polysaccharide export protein [Bacteroidota bacterium]
MRRKSKLFHTTILIVVLGILLPACKTREKLVYFQHGDLPDSTEQKIPFEFRYKPNDIVSINISSSNPELVKPFNANLLPSNYPDGYTSGNASRDGYLIDEQGEIQFPVIGSIKIGGLSRTEAIEVMTKKLKEYVDDPIVNMRVTNFKVTILGSVNQPGTFNIPNERISLLEALGLAKDTKITGIRKNVLIIRDEDGQKKEYRIDLTSREFYKSQVYYLEQNDVVYVEPNKKERFGSTVFKSSTGIFVSSVTVVLTALNIILNQ